MAKEINTIGVLTSGGVTACMLLRICATTILPFILPEHFHSRSILIRLIRTSFVQTKKSWILFTGCNNLRKDGIAYFYVS